MLSANSIKISVKEAFNIPVQGKKVRGLDDIFNPAIPAKDEDYYFHPPMIRDLLAFIEMPGDDGYWLWGLHGTGKTSLVQQTCARLNFGCYSVNGSSTLEIEDLLYQNVIHKDGTTGVELNSLAKAFLYGGIFLFNEIDLVDPSRLAALNEILSGSTLIIPGIDEILNKHPNFRFIVTANTNGSYDDETGMDFGGTTTMNLAFMDRFIINEAEYLPVNVEKDILINFSKKVYREIYSCNQNDEDKVLTYAKKIDSIVERMIKVATESRLAAKNSTDFNRPISMRGLKRWVQKTIQFHGAPNAVKLSLRQAITNGYPKHQRVAIEQFYSDVFNAS